MLIALDHEAFHRINLFPWTLWLASFYPVGKLNKCVGITYLSQPSLFCSFWMSDTENTHSVYFPLKRFRVGCRGTHKPTNCKRPRKLHHINTGQCAWYISTTRCKNGRWSPSFEEYHWAERHVCLLGQVNMFALVLISLNLAQIRIKGAVLEMLSSQLRLRRDCLDIVHNLSLQIKCYPKLIWGEKIFFSFTFNSSSVHHDLLSVHAPNL